MKEKTLQKFAETVLTVGVNLQQNQGLEIICPVEKSEVATALTEAAYKMKAKIVVPSDADDETIKAAALAEDAVKKAVDGKQIVKAIIVKGRLVNLIVK